MQLDLSKVQLSDADRYEKNLKIPKEMTPDLAEFLGFHIGDGHMSAHIKGKSITRRLDYTSNLNTEIPYVDNHIIPLIQRLFNIKPIPRIIHRDSTYSICIYSKGLFTFMQGLGVPVGKKQGHGIPKIILENKEFIPPFLRGLGDTDFSFCLKHKEGKLYPVINIGTTNKPLIEDLSKALNIINIPHYIKLDYELRSSFSGEKILQSYIAINGESRAEIWLKLIGFNNPIRMETARRMRTRVEGVEPSAF